MLYKTRLEDLKGPRRDTNISANKDISPDQNFVFKASFRDTVIKY